VNNNYDDDLDYDKNSNLPIINNNYTTKPHFCPNIFEKLPNYFQKRQKNTYNNTPTSRAHKPRL